MRKHDMTDARLKATADRCHGCKGEDNPRICEAAKQQGACAKLNGGPFPPAWGQMRPVNSAKQQLANDFMEFFERQGVQFVDVTPRPARLECRLELRTVSGLNVREHWAVRKERVASERAMVAMALRGKTLPDLPVRISLVRVGPRELDSDNLQAALKGVRDEIAKTYGVNDRSKLYSWEYTQRRGDKKEWAVEVRIEQVEGSHD